MGTNTTAVPLPPLPNHVIDSKDSFNAVTSGAIVVGATTRRLAGLYFYMALDRIVDAAHCVALDFFAKPELYKAFADPKTAERLARLKAQYGNDERVPSKEQRQEIFEPIFGGYESVSGTQDGAPSPSHWNFPELSRELMGAAEDFVAQAVQIGVDQLRGAVNDRLIPFKAFLSGYDGETVRWSRDTVLPALTEGLENVLGLAYPVLRDPGVTAVFGVRVAPVGDWPYRDDPNGTMVLAKISESKAMYDLSQEIGWAHNGTRLTWERFSNLQTVALRGAEAIATAIDINPDPNRPVKETDRLIGKLFSWAKALRTLQPAHPQPVPPAAQLQTLQPAEYGLQGR